MIIQTMKEEYGYSHSLSFEPRLFVVLLKTFDLFCFIYSGVVQTIQGFKYVVCLFFFQAGHHQK